MISPVQFRLSTLAMAAILPIQIHAATPSYTIERIGLFGAGYTDANGFSYSTFGGTHDGRGLNSTGMAVGNSYSYSGNSATGEDT